MTHPMSAVLWLSHSCVCTRTTHAAWACYAELQSVRPWHWCAALKNRCVHCTQRFVHVLRPVSFSIDTQAFQALLVFVANLALQAYCQPYHAAVLNRLEMFVLVALCVTQACSLSTLLDVLVDGHYELWVDWFVLLLNILVIACLFSCALYDIRARSKRHKRRKQLWALVRAEFNPRREMRHNQAPSQWQLSARVHFNQWRSNRSHLQLSAELQIPLMQGLRKETGSEERI